MTSLIEIMIDADGDRASKVFQNTAKEATKMASIVGGISLATAGLAPALIAGLGGAVALFGTAGLAATGFGALAMTSIAGVVETTDELAKVQEKIDMAKQSGDAKALSSALAEQQQIMSGLTTQQKRAVTSLQDFKENWKDMQDEMAPTTFTLMANGLEFVNLTMTKMFPAMKGVGDSFTGMIGNMNLAIEQGKANAFFEHINTFAVPMFNMAMQSAGNILKGLGNIMIAFTPLGMQLGAGMVDLTAKFASWTAGLQSSTAFQSFVTFVQSSTPIIINIIGQLWNICTQLVVALQPMALVVLNLARSFLSWATESGALKLILDTVKGAGEFLLANLNSIKQVIPALVAGFIAFKVALAIGNLINSVSTALRTATTVASGMRAILMALNLTMLASPWFWVAMAIGVVVTAGVLLYKNWDEVKKYAQQLWDKIKAMWAGIKQSFSEGVSNVKKWFSDMWSNLVSKASQLKSDITNRFDSIKTSISNAVENAKTSAVNKFNSMKSSVTNTVSSLISTTVNFFSSLPSKIMSTLSSLADKVTKPFRDGMKNADEAMRKGLNNIINSVKEWFSAFTSSGKGLLSAFVDGIKSGFGKAVSAVSSGMKEIRQYLPFSPAKKGPLSDLDKSGKAFFPTWYESALTQVGTMQRVVGKAFTGVANEADVALAGTGLEAFTGGRNSMNITITHKHEGELGIDGSGLDGLADKINQSVVQTIDGGNTGAGMFGSRTRQAIQKY